MSRNARGSSDHKMGRKMRKTLRQLQKENPNLTIEKKNNKNAITIKDNKGNMFATHCGSKLFNPMRRWLNETDNKPSFRVC